MAREIVLDEIEKRSGSINFYLRINERPFVLRYRFDMFGGENIDVSKIEERFDPIVIIFMYFALTLEYDFRSNYPIAPELYYRLTQQFVPQMRKVAGSSPLDKLTPRMARHDVKIFAPFEEVKTPGNWIGTGLSCGIDSLLSIYEYSQLCKIPGRQLTHLVCMKTGAHHGNKPFNLARQDRLFHAELERARRFAKSAKLPLLAIDTNLAEVLHDAFFIAGYAINHTFRTLGTITLLQNYFSLYYFGDTHGLDHFSVNVNYDCSTYERWFIPLIASKNLNFYLADGRGGGRFEKTKLLTDYPLSYDALHVCWYSEKNCGKCAKCMRTLVALDMLGALDKYKNAFDIETYKKNRIRIIKNVIRLRHKDSFFNELYEHMSDDMKKLS